MEDDENEWRIREGHGPPPLWARRAEEEEEPPKKKARLTYVLPFSLFGIMLTVGFSPERGTGANTSLHVVDQAVLDIAKEFRFTVDEVKEYYDKCGDVNRTRNRFRRMREVFSQLPDDEPPTSLPVPEIIQAQSPPTASQVQGSQVPAPMPIAVKGTPIHAPTIPLSM